MKPFLLALAAFMLWQDAARATTYFHFSQNGAGAMDGTTNNPQSLAWVNAYYHVGPGTNLWLDGTINSAVGIISNYVTLNLGGNGIATPNAQCVFIYPNVVSPTIDGTGGGYLACTANGTLLTNQTPVWAINCGGTVTGLTVKNLIINNIYVNVAPSDPNNFSDTTGGIYDVQDQGNSFFLNIRMTNVGTAIAIVPSGTATVSNFNIYNQNHGIELNTTGLTGGNLFVENSFFGDTANWDASGGQYHHDSGFIWFGSGTMNSVTWSNVMFIGNNGTYGNAAIYNQSGVATNGVTWINLVAINKAGTLADGLFNLGGGSLVGSTLSDNTGSLPLLLNIGGGGLVMLDNIFNGGKQYVDITSAVTSGNVGANLYANTVGGTPWQVNGTGYTPSQFSTYQSVSGGTTSRNYPSTAVINTATGTLLAGSPAIHAGLYESANPFDILGATRPNPPSIGAYEIPSSPGAGGVTLLGTPSGVVLSGVASGGVVLTGVPQQ
jgi:hypothetical protein